MKRSFIILSVFLLGLPGAFSQKFGPKADSILKLINAAKKEDTNQVRLMTEYFICLLPVDRDSAYNYSRSIIERSRKMNYNYGLIKGLNAKALCEWYGDDPRQAIPTFSEVFDLVMKNGTRDLKAMVTNNLGVYYMQMGISDTAEKYQKMAVQISAALPDPSRHAKALRDLGMIYSNQGNYRDAIMYYMEAKKYILHCKNNLRDLFNICNSLGVVYLNIGDFNRSVSNFREARKYNSTLKDPNMEINVLTNLGVLYYSVKNDLDSAKIFLSRALEMTKGKPELERDALIAMVNLGNVAIQKEEYRLALSYYLQVINSPQILSRNYEHAAVLVNLGVVYQKLGNYSLAEKYAAEGVKLASENSFRQFEEIGFETLAGIAAGRNNFSQAYHYLQKAVSLKDTLWNQDVEKKVAEATFSLALQQKETENSLLQKDLEIKSKTIYLQWFLIGGTGLILLFFIILVLVIFRNQRRVKKMNQALDLKNKQLEESNLTKDKFFSIIAHDLRSPFTGLLGLLSHLDENYDVVDEETRHTIIHELRKGADSTFNLLSNLLDWARAQQGQLKSHPEEVEVEEIVDEVFSWLGTRANSKNQTLQKEIAPGLTLFTDPRLLKGTLINLVNNSIKFTTANGSISVKASPAGAGARIEVTDNGIGIPGEQLQNLFRIGSHFKRIGTDDEPGTGLGLIMCREYITLLGGEVSVKSEEGAGTTFLIELPAGTAKSAGSRY